MVGERGDVSVNPDLSVVIPVHNGERHVQRIADQASTIDSLTVQVVFVNDGSSDSTGPTIDTLAQQPTVVAAHLDRRSGAGVARNSGFEHAVGRYTLFFDVDDVLHVDALLAAVRLLDSSGVDVAVLPWVHQRRFDQARSGLAGPDAPIWKRYLGQRSSRLADLAQVPRLLEMTNFPWNKVIRTDHYRPAGLRFGSTPVHNDVLGHWMTLLEARGLVLVNRPIATHVVLDGADNLTNLRGVDRLPLVDALDETYDYLEARPVLRQQYAHNYWAFATRLMTWGEQRVLPEHVAQYRRRRRHHLSRIDLSDFARLRLRRDSRLADALVDQTIL